MRSAVRNTDRSPSPGAIRAVGNSPEASQFTELRRKSKMLPTSTCHRFKLVDEFFSEGESCCARVHSRVGPEVREQQGGSPRLKCRASAPSNFARQVPWSLSPDRPRAQRQSDSRIEVSESGRTLGASPRSPATHQAGLARPSPPSAVQDAPLAPTSPAAS